MDSIDAREHLEMVDRILSRSARKVHLYGWIFVVWGVAVAITDSMMQLFEMQRVGIAGPIVGGVAILGAVAYMFFYLAGRRRTTERISVTERQVGRIFSACWIGAAVVSYGSPHIFNHWAASAIWSVCAAISLLFIGFQGDRRSTLAAGALLLSVVLANVFYDVAGFVLAAGFIVGYVGLGAVYLLAGNTAGDASCDG